MVWAGVETDMVAVVAMMGSLVFPAALVLLGFAASAARRATARWATVRWATTRWAGRTETGRGVGAQAGEELHALLYAGKRVQLEQRRIELVLRDDEHDGAPPRTGIDLAAGTAGIRGPGN
ncbi:DUF6191 domain-containing protein [Kitasatospora sp. CB02891]|uniref:DUF6191 domain-containing protein n=1 Tax=Kitasatospora sp. CB02891 TaxID=2020329 RepID=UPI000C273C99|nr:DUF6191 domain-containing protein [Kitasatospora sp. CB02891]PJN22947.1 hypothetical protein CG736_24525 [Kitasatospora sp. CB02891]